MPATLTLDLGNRIGWALRLSDRRLEHGWQDFTPAGHEGEGVRFLRFRRWLLDQKQRVEAQGDEIGRVLYERVDFIPKFRTGAYAVHVWGGLWACLTSWCEHHGIEYRGVAVGTIKHAITGKGNSKKPAIGAALAKLGHRVTDHNEADALALLLGVAEKGGRYDAEANSKGCYDVAVKAIRERKAAA